MTETTVKTLANNIVIKDAIALVREGRRVVLPVKGFSMNPFIIGDRESVELVSPHQPLKVSIYRRSYALCPTVGQIVACQTLDSCYLS